jgi:hypothetical protein
MSHPHLERCTARRRSAHEREIGTAEAFTQPVPGGIPERIRRIATLHPSGCSQGRWLPSARTHVRHVLRASPGAARARLSRVYQRE